VFKEPQSVARKLPCSVTAMGLVLSLVLSALITTVALHSPDDRWVAWFCFLPLFIAVRLLSPTLAAMAGGLWGASLYLFTTASRTAVAEDFISVSSVGMLALLIAIPAIYLGLAARPARAIGFRILTLALGWTLIEAVLHLYNNLGPQEGLLTGSQGEGLQLHWLTRLLGYVATAVLVASLNVSLVGFVSTACLNLPVLCLWAEPPEIGALSPPEFILLAFCCALRRVHPRAPPILVVAP